MSLQQLGVEHPEVVRGELAQLADRGAPRSGRRAASPAARSSGRARPGAGARSRARAPARPGASSRPGPGRSGPPPAPARCWAGDPGASPPARSPGGPRRPALAAFACERFAALADGARVVRERRAPGFARPASRPSSPSTTIRRRSPMNGSASATARTSRTVTSSPLRMDRLYSPNGSASIRRFRPADLLVAGEAVRPPEDVDELRLRCLTTHGRSLTVQDRRA